MRQEVGGRFKREGTYGYLWLIHVAVWQKPVQYYNAIILQLKNKLKKNSLSVSNKKKVIPFFLHSVLEKALFLDLLHLPQRLYTQEVGCHENSRSLPMILAVRTHQCLGGAAPVQLASA